MIEALRKALLSRRISPTKASLTSGLYNDALNSAFRGARSLPLDEIDQVLEAHCIPIDELLETMTAARRKWQRPPDPPSMLASVRGVPYPFSADLRIWLTYCPTAGSGRPSPALPPQVAEIESLRAKDREEALERARLWVGTFRNRLRGATRGRSFRAEAVCEFAIALGVWGSVASCMGLKNDASFALEHALRLHEKFRWTRGYVRLLLWSAPLLASTGSPEAGLLLTDRALSILASLEDQTDVPLALVLQANMASLSGHAADAAEMAGAILRHPGSTSENRAAAHILRTQAALADSDLYTAETELSLAETLVRRLGPRREAIWLWNRARLEAAKQQLEKAKATFCDLLSVEPGTLEVADRFWIFFELAELLLPMGDLATLRAQAREMKKWLPFLDASPINKAIVSGFFQVAIQRFPEDTELTEAKSALQQGPPDIPPTAEPDQPKGSMTGPNSGSPLLEPGFGARVWPVSGGTDTPFGSITGPNSLPSALGSGKVPRSTSS